MRHLIETNGDFVEVVTLEYKVTVEISYGKSLRLVVHARDMREALKLAQAHVPSYAIKFTIEEVKQGED